MALTATAKTRKKAAERAKRTGMTVSASYQLSRYKRLKRAKLCVTCGKEPNAKGIIRCDDCAKKQAAAQKAHNQRAKAK